MKVYNKIIRAAAVAGMMAIVGMPATPVHAALPPTAGPWAYVVVSGMSSSWPTQNSIDWIDRYTKTDLRLAGYCRPEVSCIKIRSGKVGGTSTGWTSNVVHKKCALFSTSCKTWTVSTITIDTGKASKNKQYNWSTKRWLVVHEIGHAFGLDHRTTCKSPMQRFNRCAGKVPTVYFMTDEQKHLAKR